MARIFERGIAILSLAVATIMLNACSGGGGASLSPPAQSQSSAAALLPAATQSATMSRTLGASATTAEKVASITTVAVPRTGWQEVSLSTTPGSRCSLPDSAGKGMTIYADGEGHIQMYVRATGPSRGLNTQLSCVAGVSTTVFPLAYRTRSDNAVGILPPAASSQLPLSPDDISAGISRLGFDPRTMSNDALLSHNLPARLNVPQNSDQYQGWLRAALTPTTEIVRSGVPTDFYHGRADMVGSSNSGDCGPAPGSGVGSWPVDSYNWSGYEANGAQGTFGIVQAEWDMPSAATLVPSGSYMDSVWVGIDGGASHSPYPCTDDVFQTGTDTEVSSNGSYQTGTFWIFYEYFPNPSNLAFYTAPYDTDYCDVQSAPKSFYCKDETTGATEVTSDSSASINGSTAEWIVERPCSGNCSTATPTLWYLLDYGTTNLSDVGAQLTNGVGYAYSDLSSAWALYDVTMISRSADSYPLSQTEDAGTSTFSTFWSASH
jgi:hypothetical protein